MREAKSTLICPELATIEDYVKQREKSRSDFEQFAKKRNASKLTYINGAEKKRM